jgi:cytochrome c
LRNIIARISSLCSSEVPIKGALTSSLTSVQCTMSSFAEAPEGNSAKGAKIFKTKCSQCHVPEKGAGHKQVLQSNTRHIGHAVTQDPFH